MPSFLSKIDAQRGNLTANYPLVSLLAALENNGAYDRPLKPTSTDRACCRSEPRPHALSRQRARSFGPSHPSAKRFSSSSCTAVGQSAAPTLLAPASGTIGDAAPLADEQAAVARIVVLRRRRRGVVQYVLSLSARWAPGAT